MNLLSQSGSNIFVQHKTKQKTIQTWTLSGPDVCLEDPRRLCKEKLLLFLNEAFEHPLKPETKFEYMQFLNISNVWTYAMFEHLQCLKICNDWTSVMFEHMQFLNICNFWTWISAVMNLCDNQIYTLLLQIHIQMFAKPHRVENNWDCWILGKVLSAKSLPCCQLFQRSRQLTLSQQNLPNLFH